MLIREKIGNLKDIDLRHRHLELVDIEWFETGKRILHKKTHSGKEIGMKFLKDNPNLLQDDVLFENEQYIVVVNILPCAAIVLHPETMYQMASLCYEIGNKHLPLFFENDEILVPYEVPLFRLLQAAGFEPRQEKRKLMHPLKTSVSPHIHSAGGSLFSKILQATTSSHG